MHDIAGRSAHMRLEPGNLYRHFRFMQDEGLIDLVGDGQLDASRPEFLMYEQRNGQLRLVGVEHLVIADAWHASNAGPPVLNGQHLHYVGSPNRYGLPPFYELHVWAWVDNPNGTFTDWNPRVSCAECAPEGE